MDAHVANVSFPHRRYWVGHDRCAEMASTSSNFLGSVSYVRHLAIILLRGDDAHFY